MDYLKTQGDAYKGATQKDPKAKRELIQVFTQICALRDVVEREIKDKASFDAQYEKCASSNCKIIKDLNALAASLAACKKAMDVVRSDRKDKKKRATTPETVAPKNTVVHEPVEEDPVAVRAPKKAAAAPKAAKKKEKISKETREQIWERYIGDKAKADCPVCRKRTIRMTDFSAGHIVAEACGGVTDSSNLMPICGNCNSRMATTNLYDYCRKEFGREPEFGGGKE
jgi:5-methylcytosine-specific restriction endonuclease McrA